jgi:hypothetical protein
MTVTKIDSYQQRKQEREAEMRGIAARIQAQTGGAVNFENALLLAKYQNGRTVEFCFSTEQLRFCEALEKKVAKIQAERAVNGAGRAEPRARDSYKPEIPAASGPRVPWTVPLMQWRDPASIPRRQFIYGFYYARAVLSATIADGGIGKSLLKLVEMLAMATGRPLLGITPQVRVRALCWNGDDPYDEVERRIHAICKHYNINLREVLDQGWLSIGTSDAQPLCFGEISKGGLILNPHAVDDVCALIKDRSLGLVCFDPFKSLHQIPENDNTNIEKVADALKIIGIRSNAAIAVDHHVRKPAYGQNEVTTADARGASALINKARLSRVLNSMTSKQAIEARLKEGRRKYYFRADTGKGNIDEPNDNTTWYEKLPVLCDNGEYTPVVTTWTYPNAFDTVTTDHMHRARVIAAAGSYRKDPQSDDWIGKPVAEMLDLDISDDADRKQLKSILKKWFANGVLDTKERYDEQQRKKRPCVVPGNWKEAPADGEDGEPDAEPIKTTPQGYHRDPNGRPLTKDGYEVVGPEPDGTACAQCRKAEGTVYLIRDPRPVEAGSSPFKAETLHEDCAKAWFDGLRHHDFRGGAKIDAPTNEKPA